ncbi:hypothetical protein [Sinorhizobium saheli]|jgi:hypothetical protein|uniref:Uncharacterized protein n=1 Tax=Sinorhizobium saheli TaxID=36856 RepID=A0A178YQ87_SINSA|nr:hypothetical protein [Sinorhizobium saheli]MQW85729.1 hypothetical protein [Sinorhizobium saheli]OAP49760.1 hypothetical protein ATB98_03050 [Sinorhizobium saheli]
MSTEIRRNDIRNRGQSSALSLRPDAAQRAQSEEFDARLLQSLRQTRRKTPTGNVRAGGAERARLSNATLFDLSRSQEILTYIVQEVLPGLDLDEDIAKLTASMLNDEIESRRDLQHRLMQAQSS